MRVRLLPAEAGRGIVFRREDMGGVEIPARYDRVSETHLGTTIAENGASVSVIEHLMAAAFGAGIDDLLIVLNGPEPPILDGDALCWLKLIERSGTCDQGGDRRGIRIKRRVGVQSRDASAALSPSESLEFDFGIEFNAAAIGTQHLFWPFSTRGFRQDIAPARTFGFVHELDTLLRAGLAKGASLDNTLAIDGGLLRNPERLRFTDEFVRHKILDAVGDLALANAPIIGRFEGRRSGHALNNRLLHAVFSDPANFEFVAGLDRDEGAMA